MATIAASMANAVNKSLLAKLPSEAASKFNLDEAAFKTFLQEFLASQLTVATKAARVRREGPKDSDGKGRVTGYLYFSQQNRERVKAANPEISFQDLNRKIGEEWNNVLSDADREEWKIKAARNNEERGLPATTPSPAATKKRVSASAPAAADASAGAAGDGEGGASVGEGVKVTKHAASGLWVIQGTTFVVKSSRNKVVTGKLRADKQVALTSADRSKCEASGWQVEATGASAASEAVPSSAAPPVVRRRVVKA